MLYDDHTNYGNNPSNGVSGITPTLTTKQKVNKIFGDVNNAKTALTNTIKDYKASLQDQKNPYGGGGGNYTVGDSSWDAYQSYIDEYRKMIADYQAQLDALAEDNYKSQVALNEQQAKDQRNQANLNAMKTDRWLNQQYGGGQSGMGVTNSLRNKTNLNNTISNINQNLANNNSTASLNRYNAISNNKNQALGRYAEVNDSYLNYLKKIM